MINSNSYNKILERILNFGEGTISKWKTSNPSIYKVLLAAEHFNVSIDYLVGRTNIASTVNEIINDADIRLIQLVRERMCDNDKLKMMALLRLAFPKAFSNINSN